jgi:transposase
MDRGAFKMAKLKKSADDLSTVSQLLRNLLAIELWRGGLSQAEIGERLGVSAGTVNGMLKAVNRVVLTKPSNEG